MPEILVLVETSMGVVAEDVTFGSLNFKRDDIHWRGGLDARVGSSVEGGHIHASVRAELS